MLCVIMVQILEFYRTVSHVNILVSKTTVNNILVITSSGDNIEANYGLTLIEDISIE